MPTTTSPYHLQWNWIIIFQALISPTPTTRSKLPPTCTGSRGWGFHPIFCLRCRMDHPRCHLTAECSLFPDVVGPMPVGHRYC